MKTRSYLLTQRSKTDNECGVKDIRHILTEEMPFSKWKVSEITNMKKEGLKRIFREKRRVG